SILQNGMQITLNGTATVGATIVVNPAELLIAGAVDATYQNSVITFGSTGPFANQTWTKLNLPGDFRNPAGALVHIIQNGSSVTFVDRNGAQSPGTWLSPNRLSAYGETVTIGSDPTVGQLLWDDGTVWNESVHLTATSNGSPV